MNNNSPYNLALLHQRTKLAPRYNAWHQQTNAQLLTKLAYFSHKPQKVLLITLPNDSLAEGLKAQYPDVKITTLNFFNTLQANWANKQQKYDLIICSFCLYWHPDPLALFKTIHNILTPDGVFLFNTLGPDSLKELRQAWHGVDNHPHINDFNDMHDLGDLLLASGFVDPVMDAENLTLPYANPLELMRDIKKLGENNCNIDRFKGLTGKNSLRKILANPGKTTIELIHGHAIGAQPKSTKFLDANNEVKISMANIMESRSSKNSPDQ